MTSVHKPDDTRIFHKECMSLAHAGYEVYLVACVEHDVDCGGVHIIGAGQPSDSRLGRMTHDAKAVYKKALELDADIYHFHDPELIPFGVKLKKRGKLVIFDSHELYPCTISVKPYIPRFSQKRVAAFYEAYETRSVRKFDAAIFPCCMNGKNPFEGRCKRAVLIDNYPIVAAAENAPLACSKKSDAICYVGSLTKARGVTVMTQAAHMAGAKLILAGAFAPPQYKDELFSMPEAECVEYVGRLPQNEVSSLIATSNVGMCILQDVGQYKMMGNFPTKVMEYWLADVPVILSDFPFNHAEMERLHAGICVDSSSPEEVAKAIRQILDTPNMASQMAENGKQAVMNEYNWQHEEKKLIELYSELLAK